MIFGKVSGLRSTVFVYACVGSRVYGAAVMKLLVKVAPTPRDWLKLCVIA